MAHTPGPYHLGEAKSGRRFIYARNQEFPVKPEVKLNKTGVTKEMEDTARLFAAAPQMYDVLKRSEPFIIRVLEMTPSDGGVWAEEGLRRMMQVLSDLRDAIAKAEGRQ
jgi:hypothetical protein